MNTANILLDFASFIKFYKFGILIKKVLLDKKIQIKGQRALPSSMLAVGTTYVDILGFQEKVEDEQVWA